METDKKDQTGQVNPGDMDQYGNEAVIKKNQGISEQGNQWSDEEPIGINSGGI